MPLSAFHYTETNTNPENIELKNQLVKMFGDKATPDIASVAAWDGTNLIYQAVAALGPNAEGLKYVDFLKGKKMNSPRGPIYIDPAEREIVQNIYIRESRNATASSSTSISGKSTWSRIRGRSITRRRAISSHQSRAPGLDLGR